MADNYLRLTSLEDNNVIALTKTGSPSTVSLQYRTDLNQEWQPYTIGTELTLFSDSWIEFRNTTGKFSTSSTAYYKFTSTKTFNVSGKIGALLFYSMDVITASVNFAFINLFYGCTKLIDASQLEMNLQIASESCYQSMFQGCSSLIAAPELPSITLYKSCYNSMFKQCASLKKAPALPATTLANDCYSIMFEDCDLDEAPELPATTLAQYCYYHMFTRNRNLKKAPLIAGIQIATQSYYNAFINCSSLNEIVYTSSTVPSQTGQWLNGVASSGTFYYTDNNLNVAAISRNAAGIPAGWTIQYLAPKPQLVFSINGKTVKALTINGKAVAKLG